MRPRLLLERPDAKYFTLDPQDTERLERRIDGEEQRIEAQR